VIPCGGQPRAALICRRCFESATMR
jgi:hypothetical protein